VFPAKKQTGASPFAMELYGERSPGDDDSRLSHEDAVLGAEKGLSL
jgi:hypothetical protein